MVFWYFFLDRGYVGIGTELVLGIRNTQSNGSSTCALGCLTRASTDRCVVQIAEGIQLGLYICQIAFLKCLAFVGTSNNVFVLHSNILKPFSPTRHQPQCNQSEIHSFSLPSSAWVSGYLGASRYRTSSRTSSLTRGAGSVVCRVIGTT